MAVENINDEQFQEKLNSENLVVVKFYADWCGSCRLFSPKFRRVSEEETNADITFVEIDAENNPISRKLAGVNNLPYLAIFKNGKLVEGSPSSKEEYLRSLIEKGR